VTEQLNDLQQMRLENLILETKLGPEIRPLRGLPPNKRGSSAQLHLGDKNKTLLDARTPSQDAEMITVELGVTVIGGTLGTHDAFLTALVEWGVGGANFSATVDVGRGTAFSVVANFIRVSMSYAGTAPVAPSDTLVFQGNAAVGYGTPFGQGSTGRATLTVSLGTLIKGGGFAQIAIPNFATSFAVSTFVSIAGPTTPNLWIIAFGASAGIEYTYTSLSNLASHDVSSYALPAGAFLLDVINKDPANDVAEAKVIFALSL
jgi:hypothetical protein